MSLGLSYSEVALHRVLHEYDWPVEQCLVLESLTVVKVVWVHLGVDRQLACGWQSFLPREWVWRQDLHIGNLPCVGMREGRSQITCRRFVFPMKLPYGDVSERRGSRFQHGSTMQPWGPALTFFNGNDFCWATVSYVTVTFAAPEVIHQLSRLNF